MAGIDALAEIFSRFEMRHVFSGKPNGFAGFWIPADSRRPIVQRETAKSANFYALTGSQGSRHLLEEGFHCQFNVLGGQLILPGSDNLDELGLRHVRILSLLSLIFMTFLVIFVFFFASADFFRGNLLRVSYPVGSSSWLLSSALRSPF